MKQTMQRPIVAMLAVAATLGSSVIAMAGTNAAPWSRISLNSPVVDGVSVDAVQVSDVRLSADRSHASQAPSRISLNSPVVDGLQLDTPSTVPNASLLQPGRTRLQAVGEVLERFGDDALGAAIDVREASGRALEVHVDSIGYAPFWDDSHEYARTWTLTYGEPGAAERRPICAVGANQLVMFRGDRYDANKRTIVATGAAAMNTLNMACEGTALAKLYLSRFTEASQKRPTSQAVRQAMFKMLGGDACGDGTSFTVHGQPLLWEDAAQITRFQAPPRAIEAVWTDAGAVCLNEWRRPELRVAIVSRCGERPRCTEADRRRPDSFTSAHR